MPENDEYQRNRINRSVLCKSSLQRFSPRWPTKQLRTIDIRTISEKSVPQNQTKIFGPEKL